IYVAGEGKVAKFDRAGKALGEIELPHLKELVKDKDKMRKNAQAQLDQQRKSFQSAIQQFKTMKSKLEAIEEGKRTALQKKQLQQYEAILRSYANTEKFYAARTVDQVVNEITSRLRIINGIAISSRDLFIVCGEGKGYGYAVWRMNHDFTS